MPIDRHPYLLSEKGRCIHLDKPRQFIRKITGKDLTAHGIRSTFRDWCATNKVDHLVAESCLNHTIGSAVTRAYLRTDFFNERKEVLNKWSDFLLENK